MIRMNTNKMNNIKIVKLLQSIINILKRTSISAIIYLNFIERGNNAKNVLYGKHD